MTRTQEAATLPVFIQLTRAAEAITAALQPALSADGLTVGQLGVLEAIVAAGPMSLRALGACLLRSAPNMTIVVDNLERAGLVRRARSEADRRVVLVESTAEGLRRFRVAYPTYTRLIARFIGVLSPTERAQLATLCERLRLGPGDGHGRDDVTALRPGAGTQRPDRARPPGRVAVGAAAQARAPRGGRRR